MGAGASFISKESFDHSEVRQIVGDGFDESKINEMKDSNGMVPKKKLLQVWMPQPGLGTTVNTNSVAYTRYPDTSYDEFLRYNLKSWCLAFWGHEDFGSKMWGGENTAMSMCKTMFGSWPRGNGLGQLMLEPIIDNKPVEERGVSKEWLEAVWKWNQTHMWWTPQTRVWISCFVKPITAPYQCCLYDLVPIQYRKNPDCFFSHSWDLALHCIFKASEGNWNATSYWIDGFAINQHAYGDAIAKIGSIVKQISNTVVILRGEGPPIENLRCMYRSWCIYEIAHTPEGCLRCAITAQNGDHNEYSKAIRVVDIRNATASYPSDKEVIDQLVLEKFSSFEHANEIVRRSIMKGYYDFFCEGNGFGTPGTAVAMSHGRAFADAHYKYF